MGLMDLFAQALNQKRENKAQEPPPTVAKVATVTVATAPDQKIDQQRKALFASKGVSDDTARTLAERLTLRDSEVDNRRACPECASYRLAKCKKNLTPFGGKSETVLHRCKGFEIDPLPDPIAIEVFK